MSFIFFGEEGENIIKRKGNSQKFEDEMSLYNILESKIAECILSKNHNLLPMKERNIFINFFFLNTLFSSPFCKLPPPLFFFTILLVFLAGLRLVTFSHSIIQNRSPLSPPLSSSSSSSRCQIPASTTQKSATALLHPFSPIRQHPFCLRSSPWLIPSLVLSPPALIRLTLCERTTTIMSVEERSLNRRSLRHVSIPRTF